MSSQTLFDNPFTLASPTDRERYRLRARYRWENGLALVASHTTKDYENSNSGWMVPVAAGPAETSLLAGSWRGEYSSAVSRRVGIIRFFLEAEFDATAAYGDVLMFPRDRRESSDWSAAQNSSAVAAQVLQIRLVTLRDGAVFGALEPYRDPECGCLVSTAFSGEIAGDTIEGAYLSQGGRFHLGHSGRWRVQRSVEPSQANSSQ